MAKNCVTYFMDGPIAESEVEAAIKSLKKEKHLERFIHSGHFYSATSSTLLLRGAPDYSTDTVSEFHAEAHRQHQAKDLPNAQGPYVVGVEPTTLRLKVIVSTKAPPRPTTYQRCTRERCTHWR